MNISEKTGILKVYMGETDKVHGRPLFEEIVFEARNAGLAGATVTKGIMSFGASHSIHTQKNLHSQAIYQLLWRLWTTSKSWMNSPKQ